MKLLPPLVFLVLAVALSAATDPLLSTWSTGNASRYAKVWQTTADRIANTPSTTWPRAGVTNMGGGQSIVSYSDVQRVAYSASYVYIQASGLSSHMMGPWYINAAKTQIFGNWPSNGAILWRFPRSPSPATTKTASHLGPIALGVNGVDIFSGLDALSYANASHTDSMNGDKIWNRDALVNEAVTFDAALAHQPQNGQYHYHVNPVALRYQRGDHVTYDAANDVYAEATSAPAHSPILGWSPDGYPIYGPYGYGSAMDATGTVRRMVGGYVKRDGTNGTTNLTSAGRVSLPKWAADVQARSQTLSASQYGPAVSSTYVVGYYQEDYDYLGDLGKTQGTDFDLDRCNGRTCVTPEYPNGTYAYFVTIDAVGAPAWPYLIGPQFYGNVTGGSVTSISETVTDYTVSGPAAALHVSAVASGTGVLVSWNSAEGATYRVESSVDNATWTTLSATVTSAGTTTSYTATSTANYYRVTLTAIASYASGGSYGTPTGQTGTQSYSPTTVGSSGTARLVNISSRSALGGVAGTPIVGFVLGGTGSQPVLMRAAGPALAGMSVTNPLADPSLRLVASGATLGSNDNWSASDATLFASLGAFAFGSGSKDAALSTTLAAGVYSAPIAATDNGSGVTLLEVYDAAPSGGTAQLVNLSSRAYIASGDVLIAGFVINGTGTLNLLIRGVGPGLSGQGVTDFLSDPKITLYRTDTVIASNDNWGDTNGTALAAAATQTGAFVLTNGSKDAALLATLFAGVYSVVVSGNNGAAGTALAELYVMP